MHYINVIDSIVHQLHCHGLGLAGAIETTWIFHHRVVLWSILKTKALLNCMSKRGMLSELTKILGSKCEPHFSLFLFLFSHLGSRFQASGLEGILCNIKWLKERTYLPALSSYLCEIKTSPNIQKQCVFFFLNWYSDGGQLEPSCDQAICFTSDVQQKGCLCSIEQVDVVGSGTGRWPHKVVSWWSNCVCPGLRESQRERNVVLLAGGKMQGTLGGLNHL